MAMLNNQRVSDFDFNLLDGMLGDADRADILNLKMEMNIKKNGE